jgi:hypothetical protein
MTKYDKCILCPSRRVVADPDPCDSFCSDDVAVVCAEIRSDEGRSEFKVVSCGERPYQAKNVKSPNWCPRKNIVSDVRDDKCFDCGKTTEGKKYNPYCVTFSHAYFGDHHDQGKGHFCLSCAESFLKRWSPCKGGTWVLEEPPQEIIEPIDIAEWFEVENIEHLTAYKVLMDTGSWPEGFIPAHVELSSIWQVSLMSMMTAEYINDCMLRRTLI